MKAYRLFGDVVAADIVARIKAQEWEPGKASSRKASGTTKRNLELQDDNPVAKELLGEIAKALKAHALYSEHFVSKLVRPKFNWYRDAGEYRTHTDASLMDGGIRTDLACTVFLTDGYEGGELCIGGVEVKGKAGMCVVYDCGLPHYVKPVTEGDRISAITWMQSFIPDAAQRGILNSVHRVTQKFAQLGDPEMFAESGSAHERLFKRLMRN
jgi:PKHD-type hydroxylase